MQIKLAESAGFCFGVNRAVDMLYSMVDSGEKVCTLGPIIHNPQVVEDLKSRGVVIAESIDDIPCDTKLVIRTHGVEKEIIDKLDEKGFLYRDATCPFVKKIHKIVSDNSDENSLVLIAGDENHPEVQGIRSYCKGESLVFKNTSELENILSKIENNSQKSIIIVSQTTFNTIEWEKSLKILKKHYTNAKIFDTICNATNERQEEAVKLAKNSDAMIIVGGRHSSNTVKLKAVCESWCPTYLIETADELNNIDLSGCHKVGVTAGASTPAAIIKEVLSTMSENAKEIENVMDGAVEQTAEDKEFMAALEESLNNMSTAQKVVGVVTAISPSEIQVDIGRKQTGYVPVDEYSADPTADPSKELKIGDEINLIIMKTNDQEGTVMLSKKRYDAQGAWDKIVKFSEDNETVSGTVLEVVKGGVIVITNGVRVFVPASLATLNRNSDLEELLHQKVDLKIIEVKQERGRKKAVGSIKAVLKEIRKAESDAFWAQVEEGQEYHGTVKSLTNYGAFVDIGGVDGMVHISEMSWRRIKHPSDVLAVGQEIDVYIKSLDKENKKISLGYRRDEDNPWVILEKNYPVDTVIESEIVGLTTFGAFATVIPGIDGLVHISQIANKRITKPADVLKIGEKVTCKITAIDFEKHRVSLSIRALLPEEEEVIEELADVQEAPAEEAVVEEAVVEEAVAEETAE
ncbi:MAG: bifunctional 4-hydroxy-3-methylbut-2-enyl diphosphate reductase/30S ribosomal protein S1 [Ruminococcus sp.]|nr:bifunctional 4-hydroxy-3-methylbut-2-enyl diphosphate reductase/30S ribosomal protein S1 [Candidatus Copronaster equi]